MCACVRVCVGACVRACVGDLPLLPSLASFELVCGLVQPKHHKLLAHIRRTTEREKKKKKKKAAVARDDGMDSEPVRALSSLSMM